MCVCGGEMYVCVSGVRACAHAFVGEWKMGVRAACAGGGPAP